MSFINTSGMEDVKEQQPVDEGPYQLVIADVKEGLSKSSGKPMLTVTHAIEEHPDALPVYQTISLPDVDDEPKTRNFKLLLMKRYLSLADIDFDPAEGFDTDDLYGVGFEAYLKKEEVTDEDGNPKDPPEFRNTIKIPHLDD